MPDRIAEHYERHAQAFDSARRGKFVERHWVDRLLLALPRGAQILDLGCGGGEPLDRHLIDAGHQLTGVDCAPSMIALARTRFPRHRWIDGDMRQVDIAGSFNGVIAWDSLFHLRHEDQTAMIARIGAWLAPGGTLLFNTGPEHGEAIGRQFAEELYHASLDPLEYQRLLDAQGIGVVAYAPEDEATGGRTVWLARRMR